MRRPKIAAFWSLLASPLALACGQGSAPRPAAIAAATLVIQAPARIVTPDEVISEPELVARAERALDEQRWGDASRDYALLVAAYPEGPHVADYLFNLGVAQEGAQERAKARDTFIDLARRFPKDRSARASIIRAATLDAYLEDWQALASIGDALLQRSDLDDIERLVGLGSRGLAWIEMGEDARASRDVLDGLELADRMHYGDRDVLPVAVAQLRFALGEVRRVRSERIRFDPLPTDFVDQLDARCALLLEAQSAYSMAVRSVDPHWAAMAGYRVAAMYRLLHGDLMRIPPPATSKTERQRQVFFAFMHVRYRILLEKGVREIDQTLQLAERTGDTSSWIERARQAQSEMKGALAEEQSALRRLPFTEGEVSAALDALKKKAQRSTGGSAVGATRPPQLDTRGAPR